MGARVRAMALLFFIAIAATAIVAPASAEPSGDATQTPNPGIPFNYGYDPVISRELDEATSRALELEAQIEAIGTERFALEQRLAVTDTRIAAQREVVRKAEERLADLRDRYAQRIITIYKQGQGDALGFLLAADSFSDFVTRLSLFTHIAESDGLLLQDARVAAAEAQFEKSLLDDLRAQDVSLRAEYDARTALAEQALAEQEALIAKLSAEAKATLTQRRSQSASLRQQWRDSSIPIGTPIARVPVVVLSHPERTYLASEYMPRVYESTGEVYDAVCSWYGNEFNGRPSASGQIFNQDDFTCASKTLPFGTCLALSRGDRRIIVYVNDRGPFHPRRDLDLSKAAAEALGFSGVVTVECEVVRPQL